MYQAVLSRSILHPDVMSLQVAGLFNTGESIIWNPFLKKEIAPARQPLARFFSAKLQYFFSTFYGAPVNSPVNGNTGKVCEIPDNSSFPVTFLSKTFAFSAAEMKKYCFKVSQSNKMAPQYIKMTPHHEKIALQYKKNIASHRKIVANHENMTPQHEKITARHEKIIPCHKKIAARYEKIIPQHEKTIMRHEKMTMQHEKIIAQHEKIAAQQRKMAPHYNFIIKKDTAMPPQDVIISRSHCFAVLQGYKKKQKANKTIYYVYFNLEKK
jgi:hypothetical protein